MRIKDVALLLDIARDEQRLVTIFDRRTHYYGLFSGLTQLNNNSIVQIHGDTWIENILRYGNQWVIDITHKGLGEPLGRLRSR